MSTQQDIYVVGSKNRPPMLNKDNYVPWSSHLLHYAKSTSNGKSLVNSILYGSYIAQSGMNMGQDRQMQMVGVMNGLIVVLRIANQNGNGNVVATWAEGNGNGNNAEEFDLMATTCDIDEIEEVNMNCILMANLQQASTSSTQTDKAPVYDSDGLAKQAMQKEQSLYNGQVLLDKYDPPAVYDSEETLQLSQETKSREEVYFSNTSKMASVSNTISKLISIPDADFSDDTSPSVARKFLTEDEIAPIVSQVDVRVIHFEMQFLKEAAKFVRGFKSLAKEADESLDKITVLKKENKRLLRAVVSQDIMFIVQSPSVVDTSDIQTELECTKEMFETWIIKKENEYAKLWNDWYKKCEECKYDKISYDKAYHNMQHQIERLQVQLGDLKGQSMNTQCESDTLEPLSQKLDDENVSLENQSVVRQLTAFQFERPKSSKTRFFSKAVETIDFKNQSLHTREDNSVPNKQVKESVRTKPITISQPHVITKNDVNSNSNGLSSIGVESTTKTRRPQPRSNTKNDRVPSASKSSCIKNKKVECLITANHDVCVLNYVNGMNSWVNNQSENVSNNENHKKHKPKVKKSKKLGSKERLASPRPRTLRFCLRWSPTGRIFYHSEKLIDSSDSEYKSDTSVIQICLWGVNSGCSKHITENLKLLINFVWKFMGTVRFGNDHVASILDLEVSFRRNTCFIKNFKGVDLLKGNRTTNFYTINLYEMASISPIFLMARATSTKSWALCYPKNDRKDFGKLGAKGDVGFFFGYSATASMAFEQRSSKPELQGMTSGHISSGLDLTYAPSTITSQKPNECELDLLFVAMYYDYIGSQQSDAPRTAHVALATQNLQTSNASTTTTHSTPTLTNSSSQAPTIPNTSQDVDELQQHSKQQDNQPHLQTKAVAENVHNAMFDENTSINPFAPPSISSAKSSSEYVDPSNMHMFYQPYQHDYQLTKDNPLEQHYGTHNVKEAMIDPGWIDAMQDELLQLKRLDDGSYQDILAYTAHKSFIVFQMEVKSAFLHAEEGTLWVKAGTEGMLTNPPWHLYKPVQLRARNPAKYEMETCDPVGTLMETKNKLDLDKNGTPVDATKYQSMIGALLYLTSSRPDIIHATCLCARY
ncbi:hypothetical protein Tco_0189823 [Tanacetum coccineum]